MVDVLIDTEDITVLGGPESISVDLDVGPDGEKKDSVVCNLHINV